MIPEPTDDGEGEDDMMMSEESEESEEEVAAANANILKVGIFVIAMILALF